GPAARGLGRRLRPRGTLRDEEDRPERRARVSRVRHARPASRAPRAVPRGHAAAGREQEEVLQLKSGGSGCAFTVPRAQPGRTASGSAGPAPARSTGTRSPDSVRRHMKFRYTKYAGDLLDEIDLDDLVSRLSDLLLSSGFSSPWG